MHNRRTRPGSFQRGTSLVEVLVVLVILVLGIFSIARLFPGGFFTIRSAENNTFADRLAQAQLETLKQNGSSLLNAVYVYDPNSGMLDANVNLADLNNDFPNGAADATYSDINKARYISGENFTVPASGPDGVPTHVLNYGPAHIPPSVRGGFVPSPFVPGFGLVSAPWVGQTASSQSDPGDLSRTVDSPSDLLQPDKPNSRVKPSYLVDYANGQIAVPPTNYSQNFTLVVRTPGANGSTYTVPLVVPTSYAGGWFSPRTYENTGALPMYYPALPAGAAFVPGSVILTHPLTFITTNGGQDAQSSPQAYPDLTTQLDPYTYELAAGASAQVGPAGGDVYMGSLAINPRLAGQQVSASYVTVDWHIIHEDVDVPAITTTFGTDTSVTNAPVRLTLNHLRRVGDVLSSDTAPGGAATSSVYAGLFTPPGVTVTNPYDIVLMDTDTGQMQPLSATSVGINGAISDSDNDTTAPLAGQFAVSYQNGRITLPAQSTANTLTATAGWTMVAHKHLRVFYAGDYGWAVALQKNPTLYQRDDGAAMPSSTGYYPMVATQYAVDSVNTAIFFPLTDIGQSIELDDVSYKDKNKKVYQTGSVTLTISSVEDPLHPDLKDSSGHTLSGVRPAGDMSANLATALAVDNGAQLDPTSIQIGAVRGISARAVVIWKERDQWKSRTVGTILNRS